MAKLWDSESGEASLISDALWPAPPPQTMYVLDCSLCHCNLGD